VHENEVKSIMCVPGSACVLCGSNSTVLTSVEDNKLSVGLLRLMQSIIKQMLNFVLFKN